MQKHLVRHHSAYALLVALAATGCVDEFTGSNVQVDFGALILPQARVGAAPIPGLQLPSNTHYRLYGIVDQRNGQPVSPPELTELFRFEIHPVVELQSPCLIDLEDGRFPGLHLSQFARRMGQETGIADYMNPPDTATEEQRIDMSTAVKRAANLQALARPVGATGPTDPGAVKAITSAAIEVYPTLAAACTVDTGDASLIPPPTCTDDASNAARLKVCSEFWKTNPGYYEGTDRVLSGPLSGEYFGVALNVNPLNNTPIGGVQFQIPGGIEGFTAFAFYAQYDDLDGDANPDYPNGVTPNPIGFRQILIGRPSSPARGVTRVQMINLEPDAVTPPTLKASLASQMVIFSNLDKDEVHF